MLDVCHGPPAPQPFGVVFIQRGRTALLLKLFMQVSGCTSRATAHAPVLHARATIDIPSLILAQPQCRLCSAVHAVRILSTIFPENVCHQVLLLGRALQPWAWCSALMQAWCTAWAWQACLYHHATAPRSHVAYCIHGLQTIPCCCRVRSACSSDHALTLQMHLADAVIEGVSGFSLTCCRVAATFWSILKEQLATPNLRPPSLCPCTPA